MPGLKVVPASGVSNSCSRAKGSPCDKERRDSMRVSRPMPPPPAALSQPPSRDPGPAPALPVSLSMLRTRKGPTPSKLASMPVLMFGSFHRAKRRTAVSHLSFSSSSGFPALPPSEEEAWLSSERPLALEVRVRRRRPSSCSFEALRLQPTMSASTSTSTHSVG